MTTATETSNATATQATVIVAPKALVTAVSALFDLQSKVAEKFHGIADLVAKEASERKYDRKQALTLVDAAFRSAIRLMGEREKLEGDKLNEFVEQRLKVAAPDRSKVLGLSGYAKDANTPEAIAAVRKEVAKSKALGIGVNRILEHVVRGGKTAAETAALPVGAKGARPNGNASTSPQVTPAATQAAQSAKGLTPKEKFVNTLAATVAMGRELKLTTDEMEEATIEYFLSLKETVAAAAAQATGE
jgi:hypothetical protein